VGPKHALVAATPLLGAIAFPLSVPLMLRLAGLPAAVLTAVILGTLWFVAMLRSAEMPSHD
jgi:hypothetical protein